MNTQLALSLLASSLLVSPASAQDDPDANVEIAEGDAVAGVGLVTRVDNLAVNDDGVVIVELDTDNADGEADGALLRGGALLLREGQALPAPLGALLDSFDTVNIDADGDSGWNVFLDGTSGTGDDSGVYWNTSLLIQEGDVSNALGLTAGTPWIGFFECKLDGADNLLVMGSIDDPAIASTVDRVLARVTTDGAGNVLSETVLVKEGDVLPGQTETVADLETGPHNFHMNQAGQILFIADLNGDTAVDHAVYLDDDLLAQEGSPSPVAGRNWSILSGAEVHMNDLGGWVISGSLDGDSATNALIEKSGAKLVQEGDALPGTGGFTFTSFGSGPVLLGDTDNVLWYGDWNDTDTDVDTGLFLNDFLLVQEGVTTVGGVVVDSLTGVQDGYAMSPDGTWVVYEATLADGTNMAVRVHIGPWTFLGDGLAGLGGVTPRLRGRGTVAGGSTVSLELSDARPSSTTNLVIGISELGAPFKGGTMVPDVDILLAGLPVSATGELTISFPFPGGVPAGIPLWYQYWTQDAAGPAGFSASNAVKSTTP